MQSRLMIAMTIAAWTTCTPIQAQQKTDPTPPKADAGGAKPTATPVKPTDTRFPQVAVVDARAIRASGVTITFRLRDFGKGATTKSRITAAHLGGIKITTTSQLPMDVADEPSGGVSQLITLSFPASVRPGSQVLMITVTAAGRSLNPSRKVVVP